MQHPVLNTGIARSRRQSFAPLLNDAGFSQVRIKLAS